MTIQNQSGFYFRSCINFISGLFKSDFGLNFQLNRADNSKLFSSDLAKFATKRALRKPK